MPVEPINETGRLLSAAYEVHEVGSLKRVRALLHCHLLLHLRNPWGLAFAANIWLESKRPETALRLTERALCHLQSETRVDLRFSLEGDILEIGVRAAGHLRNHAASVQQHDALEKTAMAWLMRLVEVEPDSAASLALDSSLGSLQEPLERLLRDRASSLNPRVGIS